MWLYDKRSYIHNNNLWYLLNNNKKNVIKQYTCVVSVIVYREKQQKVTDRLIEW